MFVRKTILIMVAVFCIAYVWLNFDSVKSGFAFSADRFKNQADKNIDETGNYTNGQIFLFPISGEFAGQRFKKPFPKNQNIARTISAIVSPPATFRLSIPRLGISAPIIMEPTTDENRIYKKLESGVVHYGTTPLPGQPGTSIILGHSSAYPWYKGDYGSIFAQLSKLKTDDIISVEKEGQILNYKVSRSIIFYPKTADDFELRELETTTGSSLVLMTCWPTGTNAKRIAVRADLELEIGE